MLNVKKLGLSLYDTYVGEYDEYNPRYVLNKTGVPEILYVITSNNPYSLSAEDISEKTDIDSYLCKEAIKALCKINAISIRDNKYKVNFPAFLESDIELLGWFNLEVGKVLGDKIISLSNEFDDKMSKLSCYGKHDIRILRYYVIGNCTLDGGAIDFLAGKGIITTSKLQPGDRDYLIIGYEESENVKEYSDNLLCSCNNYRTDKIEFCSFGDSMGNRKDMFRFFKRVQKNLEKATEHKTLNLSYIRLNEYINQRIAKECERLILKSTEEDMYYTALKSEEKETIDFLKELGYLNFDDEQSKINCIVPIFNHEDSKIIEEISDIISTGIFETVKNTIDNLNKNLPDLTPLKHGVEFKDIANELWHLMFGATNEYLVNSGFFDSPKYRDGEGRYFQFLSFRR